MYTIKILPTHKVEWVKEKVTYNPKASCFFQVESYPSISENEVLYFNPKTYEFYTKDKATSLQEQKLYYAQKRKKEALLWLEKNDWKVNKHSLGEWEDNNPKWKDYLTKRKIIRQEIDEANAIIKKYLSK